MLEAAVLLILRSSEPLGIVLSEVKQTVSRDFPVRTGGREEQDSSVAQEPQATRLTVLTTSSRHTEGHTPFWQKAATEERGGPVDRVDLEAQAQREERADTARIALAHRATEGWAAPLGVAVKAETGTLAGLGAPEVTAGTSS